MDDPDLESTLEPTVWTVEFLPTKLPKSKIYPGFWRDLIGLAVIFIISAIVFSL
jgi:hypothetical protein